MNLYKIPKGQQILFSASSSSYNIIEEWKNRPDLFLEDVKNTTSVSLELKVNNLNNMSPFDYIIGAEVKIPTNKFLETFVK